MAACFRERRSTTRTCRRSASASWAFGIIQLAVHCDAVDLSQSKGPKGGGLEMRSALVPVYMILPSSQNLEKNVRANPSPEQDRKNK